MADSSFLASRPVVGKLLMSSGTTETPFRIVDGDATIVMCWADAVAVQAAIGADFPLPVAKDASGRAFILVYCMNYRNTTSGAYREVVFSIALLPSNAPPLASDPIPLAASLLTRTDIKYCVWRLWLDSQHAIDYGRELMGFDKYMATLSVKVDGASTRWDVPNVLKLSVIRDSFMTRMSNTMSVAWNLGTSGLWKATGPVEFTMFGTKGVIPNFDGVPEQKAEFVMSPELLLWNPAAGHSFEVLDPALVSLKLTPIACQCATGLQAIFHAPHNVPLRKTT